MLASRSTAVAGLRARRAALFEGLPRRRTVAAATAATRPGVSAVPSLSSSHSPLARLSVCTPHARGYASSKAPSKPSAKPEKSEKSEQVEKQPPDHRDLGVQQELFTTSVYSPGTPIFLPNGTRIFNRLVDFLRKQYVRYGFQEVITPTIYKKALWAKSGHLENYAEDMFTVTSMSLATEAKNRESEAKERQLYEHDCGHGHDIQSELEYEYGLKPMNCPGHCIIFAAQKHSYRDLPIRYADFSPLHRNEYSGALSGLTRVRRFHQDDGHIFCRPSQIEQEIGSTLDFIRYTYQVLGLGPYRLVLSTRPTDGHLIGSTADWDAAEDALRRALDNSGKDWTLSPGDGAFYGPKIDIILLDSDGKEHQTATVQLDFQLPKRFELSYQAPAADMERQGTPAGEKRGSPGNSGDSENVSEPVSGSEGAGAEPNTDAAKVAEYGPVTPVMIHRAVLGSVERLMALLIEHYNGKWPFWLNPRQVMVLTLNDSDAVVGYARRVQQILSGVVPPGEGDAEASDNASSGGGDGGVDAGMARNAGNATNAGNAEEAGAAGAAGNAEQGSRAGEQPASSTDCVPGSTKAAVDGGSAPAAALATTPPTAPPPPTPPLHLPTSAPSLLASVDVDASARSLPLKVREAKSKGYGAIVVVGPRDMAKGTVAVDLSGIPLPRGSSTHPRSNSSTSPASDSKSSEAVSQGNGQPAPSAQANQTSKKNKPRNVSMTPAELLAVLLEKVHTYQ